MKKPIDSPKHWCAAHWRSGSLRLKTSVLGAMGWDEKLPRYSAQIFFNPKKSIAFVQIFLQEAELTSTQRSAISDVFTLSNWEGEITVNCKKLLDSIASAAPWEPMQKDGKRVTSRHECWKCPDMRGIYIDFSEVTYSEAALRKTLGHEEYHRMPSSQVELSSLDSRPTNGLCWRSRAQVVSEILRGI